MNPSQPVTQQGIAFIVYSPPLSDQRGAGINKAEVIRRFLKRYADQAFYSVELYAALSNQGVTQQDIMATVRRAERKRLVYVRGYRTHDRQTPFKEGFLITWIDAVKPRKQALEEAVERTNRALDHAVSMSPIVQRVHTLRDVVIESTKLRDLTSFEFILNTLRCTVYEAENALVRTLQLYPDIRETKIFNAFRYFYLQSLAPEDLRAAITMKENYIRKVKGRANQIGHNWEAVVGWFIDNLTAGAKFWNIEN
jgi:hypothetical protein